LAVKQGIKRPSVAYAIANADNLYSEDGQPDFDRLKETVPELFGSITTNSDAGSGTNQKPEVNFNANIRKQLRKNRQK
jgi:hypothetical protein